MRHHNGHLHTQVLAPLRSQSSHFRAAIHSALKPGAIPILPYFQVHLGWMSSILFSLNPSVLALSHSCCSPHLATWNPSSHSTRGSFSSLKSAALTLLLTCLHFTASHKCLEYSPIPMAGLEGTPTHLTPPHPLGSPSGSSHFPSLFPSQSCHTGCSVCLSHAQVNSQLRSQCRVITWPNRLLEEMATLPHKSPCEVRSSLPVLLAR